MTIEELQERLTVTVQEAAEVLGCSPDAIYDAVAAHEFSIPTIRVGRRILVPTAPLREALGIAE